MIGPWRETETRIVYSTGAGTMCPGCGGQPGTVDAARAQPPQAIPARIVAKLRIEKKGRGKTVSVADGLEQRRS
jgi:hypothetical protein